MAWKTKSQGTSTAAAVDDYDDDDMMWCHELNT